jgi:hypothetical protein
LGNDFFGNLRFVLTLVLWSGITSWAQFNQLWVQGVTALVVILFIVNGGAVETAKNFRDKMPAFVCLAIAFFVSVLPLLVVKEKIFAYRTQTALHALIALAFMFGLERLISQCFPTLWKGCRIVLFGGVICLIAGLTRLHLDRDFVQYNVHEAKVLTEGLQQLKEFPATLVFTTPPQIMQKKDGVIAEFRAQTSPWVWAAPGMLELLLIQIHESHLPLKIALERHANFTLRYGPSNPDGLPVLDGFGLFEGTNLPVVQDPYWGTIRVGRNGWCVSDWFGVFDNKNFPNVFQCQIGWFYCWGKGGDDMWFSSGRYGVFWTNPKSFPSIYYGKRDVWFRLSPEFRDPWFENLKDKTWTVSPNDDPH